MANLKKPYFRVDPHPHRHRGRRLRSPPLNLLDPVHHPSYYRGAIRLSGSFVGCCLDRHRPVLETPLRPATLRPPPVRARFKRDQRPLHKAYSIIPHLVPIQVLRSQPPQIRIRKEDSNTRRCMQLHKSWTSQQSPPMPALSSRACSVESGHSSTIAR
jgi:hypothetical protein